MSDTTPEADLILVRRDDLHNLIDDLILLAPAPDGDEVLDRLTAAVEAAPSEQVTGIEILEPAALDWHGHLLAAVQHLEAVLNDSPDDITASVKRPWAALTRLLQAISDGEV